MSENHLVETPMLDFRHETIAALIAERGWRELTPFERIGAVHDFVRNEILFGYNEADTLSASQVLADGYGQCNTKAVLLMALLRALDVPCRFHGFTIHKRLQRGIVPELVYGLAPRDILHSWVEVWHEGRWVTLEGFILDAQVLDALKTAHPSRQSLCAYGAGTDHLQAPPVDWLGEDTYIQQTGINADLGVFDSPDAFYEKHRQLGGWRGWVYRHGVRHWMNLRVRQMRKGRVPPLPQGAL